MKLADSIAMRGYAFSLMPLLILLFAVLLSSPCKGENYDVVVYGGSSSGVMAAVQCARMGKSVVLIAQGKHLGGMTANGLCLADATDPSLIGGLTHTFFHRVWLYYQNPESWFLEVPHPFQDQLTKKPLHMDTMWIFEPHVAEKIFGEMLAETEVQIVLDERLERNGGVRKQGGAISQITMESGRVFSGTVFIDATYVGDLMAASGVSYSIGRESNSTYRETNNGIRPNKYFPGQIDPFVIRSDPSSGLLPRIFPDEGGELGQGDLGVQSYNYRMCLTEAQENGVPIEKPENYDEREYEILFRAIEVSRRMLPFFKVSWIPNKKIDANNSGPVSTDYIGMSWEYAEADYATREKIEKAHEMWQRGLLWTLQNDLRVPQIMRDFYTPFFLPKDEFQDNNHWPYELYVREARRMISDYVITEHTALSKESVQMSIGLASYPIDTHAVKYYVSETGFIKKEGGIFVKIPKPFSISYKAIVPKKEECLNLLVPVCLSASHVAHGSLRMEPVFMILGQSAGIAAVLALEQKVAVQDLPYALLEKKLLAEGQVLH